MPNAMTDENNDEVIPDLTIDAVVVDAEPHAQSTDEALPEVLVLPDIDKSSIWLDKEGKFKKGNPGFIEGVTPRPHERSRTEVAKFFRQVLDMQVPDGRTVQNYIIERLSQTQSDKVLLQFYELMLNRAYGKVPDHIQLGPDETAEGILVAIMKNRQKQNNNEE
jgi:hypothetical protein